MTLAPDGNRDSERAEQFDTIDQPGGAGGTLAIDTASSDGCSPCLAYPVRRAV